MYKITFDDIEIYDTPSELLEFETTLIREGGISSDENIFRQKTEITFSFWGDAYCYLCEKRHEDFCKAITVKIYYDCGNGFEEIFRGLLYQKLAEIEPFKKIFRTKIYDNSYSAMIRERGSNKISLSNTKSANNFDIAPCAFSEVEFFNPITGINEDGKRRVYDVLDVFNYIVSYLTDNTVTVESDYFTTGLGFEKYAITTGNMIQFGTGNFQGNSINNSLFVPSISFNEFFKEIRKKTRIFLGIEKDILGNDILRIEHENYFFNNNVIDVLTEIPIDLKEVFDADYLFSSINIGANDNIIEESIFYTYPRTPLISWENEEYNNCNGCVLENSLDLVSEYIIDSNVIGATLMTGESSYLDNIFLLEMDDKTTIKKHDNIYSVGQYIYNIGLNNYNVLFNWFGGIPECISDLFREEPCMAINGVNQTLLHSDQAGAGGSASLHLLGFNENVICDNIGALSRNGDICFDYDDSIIYQPISGNSAVYIVPFNGKYQFRVFVRANNIYDRSTGIGITEDYRWELKLYITDSLVDATDCDILSPQFGSPYEITINLEDYVPNFDSAFTYDFDITTPLLDLPVGSIIIPAFRIFTDITLVSETNHPFVELEQFSFELLQADFIGFEDLPLGNPDNINRFISLSSQKEISHEKFMEIKKNPYGVINIAGVDTHISELKYEVGKLSTFKLMATQSLC